MKTLYCFLRKLFVLSFILVSANSFAQKENESPVVKEMTGRKFIQDIPRDQTPFTPQPDAPSLIINVPANFPTIQAAINAANNNDIITIDAGTYRENITLNKYLRIRGANYGINPNTGIRGAETIIQPATSDPDPYSLTAVTFFYITPGGSGSVIDGITFDGDNTTLTSGVVMNGADVDAAEAIGAYDGISNTTVSNNIIKNINYAGIDYYNYTNGGASTYDNLVTNNKFDNIIPSAFGIGVLIYNNCYTTISDNVMTRVRIGVQTGNFYNADIGSNHSINNNTIESYRLGIFHNLAYTNATAYIITNNIFTTLAGAPNNIGIEVASIQSAVGVSVTNNNITGARHGYNLWNCPTSNTVTVSGGVLTNCKVGVFANNYDGYNSDADPSVYAMTGITMTNCDTAIWVRDNNLNTNGSTVALNINNATNIVNGSGIGLVVEGGDASVAFSAGDPIDFNTTLSKYIRLITNGTNVPSANINALDVKFGGTKGSNSTNAQLFAIEDKIDHKIDWNSLGFVTVKTSNKYVTINSFYPPNTAAASIQNGIDIATAGDTVNLGTATFNENVNLNKAVTLAGSGPASTVLTPSVACTGDGINISSSNANVKDLRVTNYNYGLRTSASTISIYNVESDQNCQYAINVGNGTNGLNIVKCKFNNNIVGGWRTGTAELISNILMDSSEVKGNGVGINNGFGIFLAATTPGTNTADNITIKNSDFSNNLKKGMYFEKLRDALIENVIMDNCGTDAAYGFNNGIDINLKYDSYSNITIQNCSITNSGSMGTATDVNNPAALAIKARDDSPSYNSDPATLTGFTLKNCFVSGPVNGLRFGEFNKVNNSPTGNTVIENNFGGAYSNKAILNKTANTIAVSCNWYGTVSNPVTAALNGPGIAFTPFLTNGTDNNLVTPGFQIVPGSCNGPFTKFYVNDNSLSGDHYTTAVGNNGNSGTPSSPFATINFALSNATSGDTIWVDAGTYIEDVVVNINNVSIHGSNYGISPNGGSRLAEAIVMRATSNNVSGMVVTITASNVNFNGFTVDGNNPDIGGPLDAFNGIYAVLNGLTNVNASKNIVRNTAGYGIRFQQATNFFATTVGATYSSGNTINDNLIHDITFGGINLRNSSYAAITKNVIHDVDYGIYMRDMRITNQGGAAYKSIDSNTVQTRFAGIWFNLYHATPYSVTNNIVNANNYAINGNTKWYGIMFSTVSGAQNFTGQPNLPLVATPEYWSLTNNTIDGSGMNPATIGHGYWLWSLDNFRDNLGVDHFTQINGGSVSNVDYGVFMHNVDNDVVNTNFLVAALGAHARINGTSISVKAAGNGIYMRDDPTWTSSNPAPLINKRDVKAEILNTTINGASAASGILVNGTFANANIHDNPSTITGAVIGVDIDGGTAAIYRNNITANGTGVRVKNSGNLDSAMENFITSNTVDGINIESTAGTIGLVSNNDLSGNTGFALKYLKPTPSLSASCNWYGSADAATVASKINGNVNYITWLTNASDNSPGTAGFQPVPGSCNGAPTKWYVNDGSTTGDVYTAAIGNDANPGTSSAPFLTITHAMTVAVIGDSIYVDAGGYPENVVDTKRLVLFGAKAGVDARSRVVGSPSITVESVINPVSGACFELQSGSTSTILDGFAMLGNVAGANGVIQTLTSTLSFVQIRNNYIKVTSTNGQGLWLNRGIMDLTIDKNELIGGTASTQIIFMNGPQSFAGLYFTNNNVLGGGGTYGIFVDGNRNVGTSVTPRNPLLQGNLFQGLVAGINAGSRSLQDAQILENTFNNNSQLGFQGGPKNSIFARNTFTGNGLYGMALTAFGSADPLRGGQGTTIQNNFFSGNATAPGAFGDILLSNQTTGTQNSNTITENSLLSTIAIYDNDPDGSTDTIHATCNWFGSTSELGVTSKIFKVAGGVVKSSPWLTNGTDNNLVTLGFQPVPGSCNGVPLTALYVNDNSLSGDHYTTAVGNNGNSGTPSSPFATINFAMSNATSGDTIWVDAGTYIEDVVVNKNNVFIHGSNYLINPNTGSRVAESIVMPATDDPEYGVLITLQQSYLTLDGFLFNGDNPALTGGNPVGSADVNTSEGICNGPALGPYNQIDHINIQNNIFNNFDYQAIYLEVAFNSNHSWNYVKNNKFDNMWEGVQTYALHTDVSYNTFTGVDRALSMHAVHAAADPGFVPQIANNTVSITWKTGYSRNIGIWVNYRDGTAPDLEVKDNTINCSDPSLIGKNFYGFYALTIKDNRIVSFSNNTITGAGNCSRGFYMSNCPSSNVTLSGGAFNNIRDYGILMVNNDLSWGDGDARLTVNNLAINMSPGSYAGVLDSTDNNFLNSPTVSNLPVNRIGRKDEVVVDKSVTNNSSTSPGSTVSVLNISNSTITGGQNGIKVSGTQASANIHDNPTTITGAVIGVDIDGGTAAIYRNNITANGTGVRVKNSGNLDSAMENFITTNTVDGINIESTAGTIGIISNNDLSGNTGFAIKYLKPTPSLSASCNWYGSVLAATVASKISGNVSYLNFLTNGADNDGGTNGFQIIPGSCNGLGPVANITQNTSYVAIQPAVNAANNGDVLEVSPGTYNEQVLVNKQVTIKGVGATKPIVDFTGTVSGKPTIFDISVPNATIENLRIRVDMTKLNSGIIASATDIDNINVKNDSVEAYGSSGAGTFGSYGNRNAISINYGGPTNYRVAAGGVDNISVTGNTVSGVLNDGFGQPRYFRSGVSFDEGGGAFNNNTLQSINHDLLGRFGSNGNIDFKNNTFIGGGIELADMNAGAGILTVSDNTFDATFANSSAPGTAVMRIKNNYNSKTTLINRNTFTNHQWGVSLENYNTVTLDSNTFTPLSGSTVYHHIAINTKSITSNSNLIVQVTNGAVLTRNTFNYSGTTGGTALSFHNHDNDAATFGTFTIGTSANENLFNSGIANFVYLDAQTGVSSGATFPAYTSLIGAGPDALTTMACWSNDVNIENNKFDVGAGLQLPSAMNFTQRTALETNLFHKPDNSCLGNLSFFMPVHNLTQNTYYMTILAGVTAANPSDVIELSEYTFNERVVLNKTLTLQGVDKTNCKIDGTGLAGTGKGIQIDNGITGVTIKTLTVQNFAGAGGNTDAGIYGIGGNNNLLVRSVIIQNNVGGSGFYANGPVNTVTIDSVTASGHTTGARGIVIWNGLKENISFTNCEVFNNNCCGMELQDGQASGVTFENNNIHDNFDNGIGIVGLQGPGENLIKGNTLLNNGRFGIEIKNPNGSGLTTGPGRIVVENNNVSRTAPIGAEVRDIVGIAAFRRGVLPGNVEIPTGVVIQNNTVSGYVQPSTSDGFGIVVEGMSHTVSTNTVSGCDVGIQRQAGHTPVPPADGDQSNLADTYFGRGNSAQSCGIVLTGNILTNTLNTRDVGAAAGSIVTNINTTETFCSIQSAINDAQTLNGHTIELPSGTYNEQVLVNKQLIIKGVGATKSVVDFTGTVSGKPTIFDVSAPNVTLENMRIRVDMTKLNSGIIASATDIDNINVKDDSIEAYGSSAAGTFGSYGNRNAISINYGGPTNYRVAAGGVDNISVTGNTVSGVLNDGFGQPRYFRSGVSFDEGGGAFNNNTLQSINHDLLGRFGGNGNIDFKNNTFIGGGIELADMNAGAGILTVSDNTFDATFANSSAPGTAVMRIKNNYNSKTTLINRNTFINHQWGVSLENYNTVTLDSNTFTPLSGSTVYHHIAINTKSITTNSNLIVQVTNGAVLTRNTFNYSGTTGGTALSFHNHDNDAASFGTFTIGTSGNENDFKIGIANFVYLDAQTGVSSGSTFPAYTSLIGAGADALTTMACWSNDVNIENNKFDVGSGLQLPSAMNFAQRTALETNLFHKPDNSCLGNLSFFMPVHNLTQNTYYMTILAGVTAANPSDVIELSEYTFNERVVLNKTLTLQGVDKTNCKIDGTGLAGTGKGIQIDNGITGVTIKTLTVQNFAGSSGNADGGIYAIGGNNNLLIRSVIIQNNVGGSGFYANGPVNTVTIDSVIASGHTSNARGIVIWNGLKENITVTNCEVFNNNCCGLELQDGQASGVTFENNNIHDNADNGIGLMGLQGPGENLIKGNTLLNNGRFGIEIKNPNGSGLATGAGRIVVENNNVSRTIPIVDNRDIVGIAAFRRSVGAGNVDVPTGVVIQNNTVSGYTQPSTSDGFGIVVEGMSHTVSTNTVSGCDVGIQRQAGHLPYPGDGDQSNLADTYFGRGNSPQTCGITITGNILTNTLDTRDIGVLPGGGIVQNINTSELFCSIQTAINDAQTLDGHTVSISAGTYTENVTLNKQLTLDGSGSSSDPSSSTIVQSVIANTPCLNISSTGLNSSNRIVVKDLRVTGATGSSNTGAGILVQSSVASGYYTFDNVVSRVNQGAGIVFNSTVSVTDVVVTNSVLSMNGNDGLRIASAVPSFTDLNVTGCQIDSNATSGFDYNPSGTMSNTGTNFSFTNTNFTRNSTANITNAHDVSFFRFYGNATLTNVNLTSNQLPNKAYGIAFTGTNAAAGTVQLNGVTCNGVVGKGTLTFQQYNDINNISLNNVDVQSTTAPWGQVIIEHSDADALNIGNTTLRSLVLWNSGGVNATSANFRHITLGTPLSNAVLADNFQIEDQVVHKIDLALLGLVNVKPGEVFVTVNSFATPNTTPSIQRGIDASSAGFIVNAGPGNFTEQLEVNKDLTIDGQGSGITNIISPNVLTLFFTTPSVNKPVIYVHDAADVIIKDLTVDGAGKGNANNRFQGIAYRNAGGTVRNCDIKGIRNTPIDGVQAGVGIYAFADNGTSRKLNVIKNNIVDFQKNATVFSGADLSAKIDSNTITGAGAVNFIAQNGIQLGFGAAGSVRYNTISNLSYTPSTAVSCGVLLYQSSGPDTTANNILTACQMGIYYIDVGGVIRENTISATAVNTGTSTYYGIDADPGGSPRVKVQPAEEQNYEVKKNVNISNSPTAITTSIYRNTLTSDGTNGVGIEMDALGTETLNATATENNVNGWDAAILFYKDAGATLNGIANDNNLSGNTFALYNLSGVTQNATCNWFGTIVPATILTKISGTVNSSPYLTNGTDFNAAPGFQPVPGSCNGILASTLNVKVIQEGFYNPGTQKLNKKDTVKAYLHLNFPPYNVLDSAKSTVDSVTFTATFSFAQPSGTYYIVIKHRNTIETWSKSGGEVFTSGTVMNYDFTDAPSKAFLNNQVQVDNSPVRLGIYSGDVNQDNFVELSDIGLVYNDVSTFATGYVNTDVTGDNIVELADLVLTYNNAVNFVSRKKP